MIISAEMDKMQPSAPTFFAKPEMGVDEFCTRAREKISSHRIYIANHPLKRGDTVNRLGAKIMNSDYVDILEQNIVCENLPNISL